MRHFFGYDGTGRLLTVELHTGGWPSGCDLNCPHPDDKVAHNVRNMRVSGNSEIVGFAAWNCGCASNEDFEGEIHPACVFMHTHFYNISEDRFEEKPAVSVFIDSEIKLEINCNCATTTPNIDLSPGQPFAMRFAGVVPDGQQLILTNSGIITSIQNSPATLTFANGNTQTINGIAPAQGMSSYFSVSGKYVTSSRFSIRGWSVQ